jgi:hypothetical protein
VDTPMKSPKIQSKYNKTCINKYGTKYPMQNAVFAQKYFNSYKRKDYVYPSGKIIQVQGYEPFGLDILIKQLSILEDDIVTCRTEVPEIWWEDSNNEWHRYYTDIYIKSKNMCIEVKSIWTYKINREKIILTKKATEEFGYSYELWILDAKGNKINIDDVEIC